MTYQGCISCGGETRLLRDDVQDWEYGVEWDSVLIECQDCQLVTHHPRIEAQQIPDLYPANYLAHSAQSESTSVYGRLKAVLARRGVEAVTKHLPSDGSFLEVGCGNAHFLRKVGAELPDVDLYGVDIDDTSVPEDIAKFKFFHGQFEEADVAPVDLIYCSNLIEHVADPTLFLEKCKSTLKPGGVLLGITPDHKSIDRYLFGKHWAGYHYPRHTFLFNHNNLSQMITNAGFQQVQVKGSYSFWYLSLANKFVDLPGTKKRGLPFGLVTAAFLPFDWLINKVRPHGSLTFTARSDDR